jgi:alpha-tubulin suppressor-like RCC1 family protein
MAQSAAADQPEGIDPVRQLAVGGVHACALLRSGTVYCWGLIGKEAVYSAESDSLVPVRVNGLPKVKSVSAGQVNVCAIDLDDQAWCWGADWEAAIVTHREVTTAPKRVAGLEAVTHVAPGWQHVCAITKRDGSVWCWGLNQGGELGNGTKEAQARPVRAGKLTGATAISTGVNNTCAVVARGDVYCWGTDSQNSQNGEGRIINSSEPVQVGSVRNAVSVVNGRNFGCTLLATKQVVCFGSNIMMQLGSKAAGRRYTVAGPTGVQNVLEIGASMFGACALLVNGAVSCWGVLGDMSDHEGKEPALVPGLSHTKSLSVGLVSACAVLETGRVMCWGNNAGGQLGNGSKSDKTFPPMETIGLPPGPR